MKYSWKDVLLRGHCRKQAPSELPREHSLAPDSSTILTEIQAGWAFGTATPRIIGVGLASSTFTQISERKVSGRMQPLNRKSLQKTRKERILEC